jgi:WD40 repeat protein
VTATFSPDSRRLVTTAREESVARIWDLATGKPVVVLKGHERNLTSAEFSHDGLRVVTASFDNTARVWDVSTGKQIARLQHSTSLKKATFNPSGDHVVTAADDYVLRIWSVIQSSQQLVDDAKRVVARCLTPQQRTRFYLTPEPATWCITGPGLEQENDPLKWRGRWPFTEQRWKDWLLIANTARSAEKDLPSLPD